MNSENKQNNIGPLTAIKINSAFENINNIHNGPNYLKLIKYPDFMTYESMFYAIILLE